MPAKRKGKGQRQKSAAAAYDDPEQYHRDLYTWLRWLWYWKLRDECGPAVAHIAKECNRLFPEDDQPDDWTALSIPIEDLERIQDQFNALPEEVLRRAMNGYAWLTAPPTVEDALKQQDISNECPHDAVELMPHRNGEVGSYRVVDLSGILGVRVFFTVDAKRDEVLAALTDATAYVQQHWPEVLNSKLGEQPKGA